VLEPLALAHAAEPDALAADLRGIAEAAQTAARRLARASTAEKDGALRAIADRLRDPGTVERVLRDNGADVQDAERSGVSPALLDRLRLDPDRLESIARGVDAIVGLPDPVGAVRGTRRLPNGLEVGRMRVPLGVIAIVYEARPNVTVDAAALCLKSGNAVVLRGGKEAFRSNQALAEAVRAGLRDAGLPEAAVAPVPTTDRRATQVLVGLTGLVDLAVPRGGPGLIRFVTEHARVPVIPHFEGVCHVYVDGAADLGMARRIVVDAKTQRPGVCNAMETLLVDQAIAADFLPPAAAALSDRGVTLRGDAAVRALVPRVDPATDDDWDTEYLDLVLSIAVVPGLDGALDHIARHGTRHTEAIVTDSLARARRFQQEVDASLVLVNASTRFNDGGELGLGAELGISTTKLHAYGPMGLEELCAEKWIGTGTGQTRGGSDRPPQE